MLRFAVSKSGYRNNLNSLLLHANNAKNYLGSLNANPYATTARVAPQSFNNSLLAPYELSKQQFAAFSGVSDGGERKQPLGPNRNSFMHGIEDVMKPLSVNAKTTVGGGGSAGVSTTTTTTKIDATKDTSDKSCKIEDDVQQKSSSSSSSTSPPPNATTRTTENASATPQGHQVQLPDRETVEKYFFRVVAFFYDLTYLVVTCTWKTIDQYVLKNETVKIYWAKFHEKMSEAKKD